MKKLFAALVLCAATGGSLFAQELPQEPPQAPVQEEKVPFSERFAQKLLTGPSKSWFAKHFFIGAKFGLFNDWAQGGNMNFSYILRPSFGYYINDRWAVGLKLKFIDSRLKRSETGSGAVSFFDNLNYSIATLLMGKGLANNFMSWQVNEFARYRATKLFWDKLNLWIEFNVYQGMKWERMDNGALDGASRQFIYGAGLYPAITYNITNKWMLYTSFELLSFAYDGAVKPQFDLSGVTTRVNQGTFTFQANPLYAIAKGIVNISIVKSF